MGRHLTALHDGRVVLTFGQAHDPNGVWYNVSEDGVHWDPAKSTRVRRTNMLGSELRCSDDLSNVRADR